LEPDPFERTGPASENPFTTNASITTFGVDEAGEIYLADYGLVSFYAWNGSNAAHFLWTYVV